MTRKPISTISYNTRAFLEDKLKELYEAHTIQAYMYIFHVGEDGDKDHFHVRLEPNSQDIDPMALAEKFKEYQPGNDKPLWIRPFRASKEADWFLYVVHDEEYLRMKYGGFEPGEKLPYKYTDIQVSELYDLDCAFVRAQGIKKHASITLATRIAAGEDPMKLVLEGENVQTINALQRLMQRNDYSRVHNEVLLLSRKLELIDEVLRDHHLLLDWIGDDVVKLFQLGGDGQYVEL